MKDRSTPPKDPKSRPLADDERQRERVLDAEREANKEQPENFKDEALTDKVIDVDPEAGDIRDLDPPGAGTR
jgi:hypothetical protein